MTDRLEDESAWAEHLYAEADPRAESKETMEVRLNSRLVKERLAIASSWIVSKMHHRSVERHWTLVSGCDFSITSASVTDFGEFIRKYCRYYRLIVRIPSLWCDAL